MCILCTTAFIAFAFSAGHIGFVLQKPLLHMRTETLVKHYKSRKMKKGLTRPHIIYPNMKCHKFIEKSKHFTMFVINIGSLLLLRRNLRQEKKCSSFIFLMTQHAVNFSIMPKSCIVIFRRELSRNSSMS